MKTLLRDESGQTLIFVALSMTIILGFTALAADVGTLLHDKRNLQIAADSAAIAGAVEEKVSLVTANVQAAGQRASTQNGFTNGSNQVTVTINTPPVERAPCWGRRLCRSDCFASRAGVFYEAVQLWLDDSDRPRGRLQRSYEQQLRLGNKSDGAADHRLARVF